MAKKKAATADEVGLLRAILAEPEEDTPRLAYADWLDEHGRPERAEFIRIQCRLARRDELDPERARLVRRERFLTEAHKKAWGELPVKPVKERTFHRGFIDDISLPASAFLGGADKLFSAIPLRTVRLLKTGEAWEKLLASPHLLRLWGLDLHNSAMSPTRCGELAACEQLANLHELNLGSNRQMGAAGVRAILGSRHLGNLRRLDLHRSRIRNDALAAFVGNKNFPRLRHLNLSDNLIGPDGASHLARAKWLSQLECLDLSDNPLGDEGVRRLAESGILAGHRSLRLVEVDLGVEGVRSLVNSPHLSELTELELSQRGGQTGDFLKEVARSTTLTKLQVLNMSGGGGVGPDAIESLVRSPLAARLRDLTLLNFLRPAALRALLTAPSLSGLTGLNVRGYDEERGEKHDLAGLLRSATHLKNLRHLMISANMLGDKDMAVIAGCAHLGGLEVLSLPYSHLTRAGAKAMIASPHFTRLRWLYLRFGPEHRNAALEARLAARFGEGVCSCY